MEVKVRFFAASREAVGIGEIEQELLAGATVKELIDVLTEKYPVLGSYAGFVHIAVNRVHVGRETELHDGDEVAWLPPVGGG